MLPDEPTLLHSVQPIESLIERLERIADPALRASMQQLVRSLMAWHGAALERLMALIAYAGEPGRAILERCAHDEVVASVMLLYDLHPLALETRVQQALAHVRPSLQAHGRDVELLSLTDGVVRVRLHGGGHGSTASHMAFKLAIEAALYETAPDMVRLEVEGLEARPASGSFIPLAQFRGVDHHETHPGEPHVS
jgi:Fe-S cluster biogenesis protein NfuA